MILLVSGSRKITNKKFVFECLDEICAKYDVTKMIFGDANGVDKFARLFCILNHIKYKKYQAYWSRYGKKAGPIRNGWMVKDCDKGVAIWDGKSTGTADTIKKLTRARKLLKTI